MDLLNVINCFVKIAEVGSIAGAARLLGVSAAAASQSLARLEQHLGVQLVNRSTRRLHLTAPGQAYYQRVRGLAQTLEQAERAAVNPDSEPKGRLCIASTSAFARHVLAPLLPAFSARYPGLALELLTSDHKVDHARDAVDVSLRIAAQLDDSLVAQRIASIPFVCCASPGYLATHGRPSTPEALRDHRCLVFRYPVDGRFLRWGFVRDGARFDASFGDVLVSDDIDVLAQMAVHDGGVARLAEFVARPLLQAGRVLPLFESAATPLCGVAYAQPEPMDLYLCVSDRFAMTAKVRAFSDFVRQSLGSQWTVA